MMTAVMSTFLWSVFFIVLVSSFSFRTTAMHAVSVAVH